MFRGSIIHAHRIDIDQMIGVRQVLRLGVKRGGSMEPPKPARVLPLRA